MTTTLTTFLEMTGNQRIYIVDLVKDRPDWIEKLDDKLVHLVSDALINQHHVDNEKPHLQKALDRRLASKAISALLGITKTPKTDTAIAASVPAQPNLKQVATKWIAEQAAVSTDGVTVTLDPPLMQQPTTGERLRRLIDAFPNGKNVKFAVRNDAEVWEFFSLDTVKPKHSGTAYRTFRKLLGAPGAWQRSYLGVNQQLAVVRKILDAGWEQAARDYATEHGRCARCDAFLSDPRSIAAKVGEDCAGFWGWSW